MSKVELDIGFVCYRCGSFDIEFLNESIKARSYRCNSCGKVFVKAKLNKNNEDGRHGKPSRA